MIRHLALTFILGTSIPGIVVAQTADPDPAQTSGPTKWEICNETSFSLKLAYAEMQGEKPAARGWKSLRSGSCLTTDIDNGRTKFLYAKSSDAHRGGIREWKGNIPLCTSESDFQAQPTIGCALQDLSERDYMPVAADEAVTTLVEIENFGTKASTAGIQRLLQDNGYEISRVDGIAGRRTSRTLRRFLEDNELSTSLSLEEQLDALETAARDIVKTVGLTLCNRSASPVWAAIGMSRKGNWESRGWWKIAADNCKQVYTDTLMTTDLSYFASQEGGQDENGNQQEDRTLRSGAAKPSQFCISESKFSVLGRENCTDNGYRAANFRVVPSDKEGLTVELTDADFAEPSSSGLRQ